VAADAQRSTGSRSDVLACAAPPPEQNKVFAGAEALAAVAHAEPAEPTTTTRLTPKRTAPRARNLRANSDPFRIR
jgi:hypothetical protein